MELSHFERNQEIRIICDASKQGLGTVLQQSQCNGEWKPICFASRYLTKFEAKYSINELELLAIFWAVERFKIDVCGVKFKLISDHKALMTDLNPNRGNKTFSSRLTRGVDRVQPFEFEVHVAGRILGMANYLSRHPTELEAASIKAEALGDEWCTVNSVISLNNVLENGELTSEQAEAAKRVNESNSINRVVEANLKQSIKKRDKRSSRDKSKKHCRVNTRVRKMSESPSIKLLNEKLLHANDIADKLIQKVISLVKTYNKTGGSRLLSPCREEFQSFSVDEKNLLYMDYRLVIPQSMRPMIMCFLHYGHPGRDSMLAMIEDIW